MNGWWRLTITEAYALGVVRKAAEDKTPKGKGATAHLGTVGFQPVGEADVWSERLKLLN